MLQRFVNQLTGETIMVDRSSVVCPQCHCPTHVEIVRLPDPSSWYGRFGEARCQRCRVAFDVRVAGDGSFR
jgi:hypothetical protein